MAESLQLLGRHPADRLLGGVELERATYTVGLLDALCGHRAHPEATAVEVDEPLSDQARQGVVDGSARNGQLVGDPLKRQTCIGPKVSRKHPGLDVLIDLVL